MSIRAAELILLVIKYAIDYSNNYSSSQMRNTVFFFIKYFSFN